MKRGILCQLFGGSTQCDAQRHGSQESKNAENSNDNDEFLLGGAKCDERIADDKNAKELKSRHRNDVNILLIGDPGTSKSQLLSYVHKVWSVAEHTHERQCLYYYYVFRSRLVEYTQVEREVLRLV